MPEVKLHVTDAAGLAEMLQFLSQRLARDPARLAASLEQFAGHPAYDLPQLRRTWNASSSCPAAATASPFSAPNRGHKRPCPASRTSTSLVLALPRAAL